MSKEVEEGLLIMEENNIKQTWPNTEYEGREGYVRLRSRTI